ncbi:hypothetical protein [Rhizobium leguminosarum]|uniref:hypothetical protein n=1 Tax=Rhizobium leguminosarum TaxID=384 RepID=UPI003F97DD8B
MFVVVLNRFHNWPEDHDYVYPCVTLKRNTWDDYGFQTTFEATLYVNEGDPIDLGSVKIGREDMKPSDPSMRVELQGVFPSLERNYFSLGQDVDYYEKLLLLSPDLRMQFANAMRDIPILGLDAQTLERQDVFRVSLIRFTSAVAAMEEGARLFAQIQDEKIDQFRFEATLEGAIEPHVIPFDFAEDSGVPHRINILVGANGVGKTQVLARLAVLLTRFEDKATVKGRKARGKLLRSWVV